MHKRLNRLERYPTWKLAKAMLAAHPQLLRQEAQDLDLIVPLRKRRRQLWQRAEQLVLAWRSHQANSENSLAVN